MNMDKSYNDDFSDRDTWVNDRLEAYMDNQLSPEEAQEIEKWLQQDDRWHEELTLAMHIRDELRSLKAPFCPPHVSREVIKHARKDLVGEYIQRGRRFLESWFLHWKPIMATVALLVITSVVIFRLELKQDVSHETISQVEVNQALDEVKWTLGYVSKTGRLTGDSVEDALAPLLKELPKE